MNRTECKGIVRPSTAFAISTPLHNVSRSWFCLFLFLLESQQFQNQSENFFFFIIYSSQFESRGGYFCDVIQFAFPMKTFTIDLIFGMQCIAIFIDWMKLCNFRRSFAAGSESVKKEFMLLWTLFT